MKRRWWNVVRMRARSIARGEALDHELDRELRFHLERQIEENLERGMTLAEAQWAARRSLDGVTSIREACRDMRRTEPLENLKRDLRYAFRSLARTPGFTAVIVLTLTLAIGANSAIFSVINGVMLKPLPYPDPNRLMRVFSSTSVYPKFPLNPWDLRDFRERNQSFAGIAAFTRRDVQLSEGDQPEMLTAIRVTAAYFAVLGVKPARGRDFNQQDEIAGNSTSVIISDRVWRRRFASDREILGRKILLDAQAFTVVGVMPPGAAHPGNDYHPIAHGETVDAWLPFTYSGNSNQRGSHYLNGIARLKPGITPAQAVTDLNRIAAQIRQQYGLSRTWNALVIPLRQEVVGKTERLLVVLLGAVGAVLLIACVNAANLLMARSSSRQREMAIRAAMGAGQSRLLRQLMTESLVIAIAGGCGGAAVAFGGVKALVALLPGDFPRAQTIHVDPLVFAFTLVIALATGILFGLAPSWQASRADPQLALRESSRGSTSSRGQLHLRGALVIGEIALATALLIGAGLMLRSFVNLLRSDPGFRPEHVLTATVSLPAVEYKDGPDIARFYDELVTRLEAIPGVQAAGAGTDIPWTGYNDNTSFDLEGHPHDPNHQVHARYHGATPDYFRALGIPLVGGRFFDRRDDKTSTQVVLINQSLARKAWPNEDAVGKRISFNTPPQWITVVGVVGDVKDTPSSDAAEPAFWWPEQQVQPTFAMSIVVRGDASEGVLLDAVRQEVHRLNRSLALSDIRMMEQVADASVATPRFSLFLVGLFASLALTLAAIGMYGVVAYSVSQRTHEFGLRMALGARPLDVQRMVLGGGLRLAIAGVGCGVLCALALTRVLRTLLFGVSAADPGVFSAVGAVAIVIACLACYIPARRATGSDPLTALRCD